MGSLHFKVRDWSQGWQLRSRYRNQICWTLRNNQGDRYKPAADWTSAEWGNPDDNEWLQATLASFRVAQNITATGSVALIMLPFLDT